MTRKAILLVLTLALVLPATLAAGGSISGKVSSESGDALPGVTIALLDVASGVERGVRTGNDGGYEFGGLGAGEYLVTASMPGFVSVRDRVRLAEGARTSVSFTMIQGSITEYVSVTASKGDRALEDIPQQVTVIDDAQIAERRPTGIQNAVEKTANMTAIEANPFRSRPNYRGLSSSRVLIVIDGERMNNARIDANATGLSPSMVDVNQVSAIEVVGGAGSSLYGTDAIAGTINLVTKPPERPQQGDALDAALDFSYKNNGSFFKGYGVINYATQKLAMRASFSKFTLNSYRAGDEAISRDEIVRLGDFANQIGGTANTFTVFDFPSHGLVDNGMASGINGQFDLWYYPKENHSFRVKVLTSQHNNLGFAFSKPPYNNITRLNRFRQLNKVRLRYEATNLADWLPKLSVTAYTQRYRKPQNDIAFSVDEGSSYVTNPDGSLSFTGDVSTFSSGGTNTQTLNEVTSNGAELQANIRPFARGLFTTGLQYAEDKSEDTYTRFAFDDMGDKLSSLQGATTPDSDYKNFAWFGQLEWEAAEWLDVMIGSRWDNWKSTAKPTSGYPLPGGNEIGLVRQGLGSLTPEMGFNTAGVLEYIDAVAAGRSFGTDRDVWTSNAGLTFHLPGGFDPFIRWGQSYREPEVTVRYLVRNFSSSPVFGVQSLPNPGLEPEEGESLDLGLRFSRRRVRASLTYFKNKVDNFVDTVISPVVFFPGDFSSGVIPIFDFDGNGIPETAFGIFFQRINATKVEFTGWEFNLEHAFPLGSHGSLTPSLSLSRLEGENLQPSQSELDTIATYYNRDDLAVRLEGSPGNVPFGEVVPFQGNFALRYTSQDARWTVDYEWRFADSIHRVRPQTVAAGNLAQYGSLKSLEGFDLHSIRATYSVKTRQTPTRLMFGVENIIDDLIFLPFQLAPQPGRTYVFGLNFEFDDLR